MFEFEKSKLYAYLGDELVEYLRDHKCYIAGGTITSLFCNRDIKDIDVYFRDQDSLVNFIYDIYGGCTIMAHTNKATLFVRSSKEVQLVHYSYFPTVDDIFGAFDYTVCMGAFDFATEQFVLHPEFLHHNSQRILKFNPNTAYPLVSVLRVQKYRDKGYSISKPELLRVLLSCMNLNITSYDELKEHLGGMYGVNYDELLSDVEGEFDLAKAIESLSQLAYSQDYFGLPKSIEFDGVDELVDSILKRVPVYTKIHNSWYKVLANNALRHANRKRPDKYDEVDGREYIEGTKFYKFVRKRDDRYTSYYRDTFEYKIGEYVSTSTNYLYFVELVEISEASYSNRNDAVLLECSITYDDFQAKSGSQIMAKGCTVIREVPREEYELYMDKQDSIF